MGLLPKAVPVTSHILRGFSTQAGGQGTLCASLGDREGAQDSPGQPIPLVVLGGGCLLQRPNLKVWTAAFPKALGSPSTPETPPLTRGQLGLLAVAWGISPWKEGEWVPSSGIQDPPSLRTAP